MLTYDSKVVILVAVGELKDDTPLHITENPQAIWKELDFLGENRFVELYVWKYNHKVIKAHR